MVEKTEHQAIGYCGRFYFTDILGQPEIEIGYRLARPFWGRGYATEAALAVREYSFNVLCLPRLSALIDPQNAASLRVAQKAGMIYTGEVLLEAYTHPDHVYALANPKDDQRIELSFNDSCQFVIPRAFSGTCGCHR